MSKKRMTRRERIAAERDVRFVQQAAAVAEYIAEPKPAGIMRLDAKNSNQRKALEYLESGTPLLLLVGSAGVGKSLLAAYQAAKLLKAKKVEKVFLVRPYVSCGKSAGSLPGTLREKMLPFFAQTFAHLEKFLGKGYLNYCVEKEKIEIRAIEHMRGQSLENCFVIVEECQGMTSEEWQMLITRIGEDCTVVCTGDQRQSDIRGINGLESTLKLIDRMIEEQPEYLSDEDLEILETQVGVVRFTPADVVRSGLVKTFVNVYYNQ